MSAKVQRLPPPLRDFEIYRLVNVQQLSQRQVAEQMKLSSTRVRQILQKVGDFIGLQLLGSPQQTIEQQLAVAQLLAAQRVDFLYGKALRAFEESLKDKETVREVLADGKPNVLVRSKQTQTGRVQFLNAAFRFAIGAAKLPPLPIEMHWESEDEEAETDLQLDNEYDDANEDVNDAPAFEPVTVASAGTSNVATSANDCPLPTDDSKPSCPPVRDCAPSRESEVKLPSNASNPKAASDISERRYSNAGHLAAARRRAFLSPAHEPNRVLGADRSFSLLHH